MSDYDVSREDAFDFLSAEYADLYHRSDATLFQHPTWLDQVYRHRAPATGSTRLVVTVRERVGARLLVVLPLVRRRRRGVRFIEFADLGVSDYAAPIMDRHAAALVLADPEIPGRVRAILGRFDVLQVQKLRGSATTTSRLLAAPRVLRLPYDGNPVSLPPDTEDWRAKLLDPSFARRLAKTSGRLRRKGEYVARDLTDPSEVDDMLGRIRSFRAARFADRRATDLLQDADCFAFYAAVARQSVAEGGPARISAITLDGVPVAATLDLVDDSERLFLIVGFDFAGMRTYSLGLLIVEELIDQAVAAGLHTFDMTIGNEGYKADFGASPVPMYAVRAPGTLRGRAAGVVIDLEARARKAAKRVASSPRPRLPFTSRKP